MGTSVYSERFLYCEGAGKTVSFVVPDGKRAILTFVSAAVTANSGTFVWLQVHGVWTWNAPLPAGGGSVNATIRLVAYERETVAMQTVGTNVGAMCCGYLFDDASSVRELFLQEEGEIEPGPPEGIYLPPVHQVEILP